MKFFVSWYPGDPWYPTYDAECNMLISVTSVSRDWRVIRYSHFPKSLVIDSGGYRFANNPDERLTPKAVLKKQLQMVGNQRIQTWVCALDYPILTPTMTANEKDYCIHQTIGYAYEMIEGMRQIKPEENIVAMAIVQGYDRHSYRFCAKELKAIGFNTFGLGSLISVKSERRMMERVDAVVQEVGAAVHVFGVSNLMMVKRFRDVGVESIDSSRPAKAAMFNQVFLTKEDGGLEILEFNHRTGKNEFLERVRGRECECPVCRGRISEDLLVSGKRKYYSLRSLHNYWHLKRAIEG